MRSFKGGDTVDKFWKYLRIAVLIAGALSLVLLFVGVVIVAINSIKSVAGTAEQKTSLYHTKFDAKTLDVEQNKDSKLLVKITDGTRVSRCEISESWVEVKDTHVYPLNGGGYGIVMSAESYDCDEATHYLYFLRYDGKLKLVTEMTMANMQPMGEEGRFLADVIVSSPYAEQGNMWHYTIPTFLTTGEETHITPLITGDGAKIMQEAAQEKRKPFLKEIPESERAEKAKEYDAELKALDEALRQRVVTF
jgi:hypothetical protein